MWVRKSGPAPFRFRHQSMASFMRSMAIVTKNAATRAIEPHLNMTSTTYANPIRDRQSGAFHCSLSASSTQLLVTCVVAMSPAMSVPTRKNASMVPITLRQYWVLVKVVTRRTMSEQYPGGMSFCRGRA